jgi:hypothetical protein
MSDDQKRKANKIIKEYLEALEALEALERQSEQQSAQEGEEQLSEERFLENDDHLALQTTIEASLEASLKASLENQAGLDLLEALNWIRLRAVGELKPYLTALYVRMSVSRPEFSLEDWQICRAVIRCGTVQVCLDNLDRVGPNALGTILP